MTALQRPFNEVIQAVVWALLLNLSFPETCALYASLAHIFKQHKCALLLSVQGNSKATRASGFTPSDGEPRTCGPRVL